MSLESRLEAVELELSTIRARLASTETGRTAAAGLPDVDIDSGEYGNPEVRKDPKSWKGESCVGRRYSECPPDYLRSMAGLLQWKAKKNDEEGKEKFAGYDRLDAARALAWAARKETESSRYGTSGAGGSAKHGIAEESLTAYLGMPPEDDAIPFIVNMTLSNDWARA